MLQAAQKGMQKGLERVKATARSNVQVQTGELRDSITCSTAIEGHELQGQVGAYKAYAVQAEMGVGTQGGGNWVGAGSDSAKAASNRGRAAHPFLYPAWKMHQAELRDDIAQAIREQVSR